MNHCRLSLELLWNELFTFKIHSCDKFWPVFFHCFFICFVGYVAASLPYIFFFSSGYIFPCLCFFWYKRIRERLKNKPKSTFTIPDLSQLKLKKNTNYCGLEEFLSLESLLWCFLVLSWDSWTFIPCWFIRVRWEFLSC